MGWYLLIAFISFIVGFAAHALLTAAAIGSEMEELMARRRADLEGME